LSLHSRTPWPGHKLLPVPPAPRLRLCPTQPLFNDAELGSSGLSKPRREPNPAFSVIPRLWLPRCPRPAAATLNICLFKGPSAAPPFVIFLEPIFPGRCASCLTPSSSLSNAIYYNESLYNLKAIILMTLQSIIIIITYTFNGHFGERWVHYSHSRIQSPPPKQNDTILFN